MTHKSDRVLPPFRFWILTYGSDLAGAQLFPKLNCPFCSLTPGSWGCHPEIPDDSLSSSCTWVHILLLQSPSCCGNKPLLKQDKKVFLAERGMINSLLQKSSPFLTGSNHICWQNPTCWTPNMFLLQPPCWWFNLNFWCFSHVQPPFFEA